MPAYAENLDEYSPLDPKSLVDLAVKDKHDSTPFHPRYGWPSFSSNVGTITIHYNTLNNENYKILIARLLFLIYTFPYEKRETDGKNSVVNQAQRFYLSG